MISLMQRLIDTGHAYAVGGDVYFEVKTDPEYGKLSGQRVDQMRGGDDVTDEALKRDPRDFALWKAAKPGEPFWDTPWGPGRPGWHLECSAMSMKYLGEAFDIHGGGIDLVFPHHENEIAQSESAGFPFAQYWMHNALLGVAGEKMSKSLGNSLRIEEILRLARPVELRYYLGGAHYRSVLEFSEDALAEAVAAYKRIEGFVDRAAEALGGAADGPLVAGHLPLSFTSAMDDDLGVPAALAAVHAAVRDGNTALQQGQLDDVRDSLAQVRAMLSVLGLDPLSEPWTSTDNQNEQCARSSARWLRSPWTSGRRPGRARTTPPPTRCAKAWRRQGSPSRTPRTARAGRSADERAGLRLGRLAFIGRLACFAFRTFFGRAAGQGHDGQVGQAAPRHGRLRPQEAGGQGPHAARLHASGPPSPAQGVDRVALGGGPGRRRGPARGWCARRGQAGRRWPVHGWRPGQR